MFTPGVANALFDREHTCHAMYFAVQNLYMDFLGRQKPKHIIGKQYMEDTIRELVHRSMDELNPHLIGKYKIQMSCDNDFATNMLVVIQLIPELEFHADEDFVTSRSSPILH